ncbi:unnamed protein product [Cuscuta campestris]|uniref:Putative plant transposon protein domain-containing protein n=1 Tax=Cuscuta campestris TaxID=132261 RepID=A0A484LN42_9ASTE|nr:unnamed protein product [Cuscuta campestris]
MEDKKSITEFHGRVRDLANEAERLGRPFEEDNLVLKVLGALPENYSVDAKAIRQAHDLKRMTLDQLMGNLETIELAMSEEQKKKKFEKQTSFQVGDLDLEDDAISDDDFQEQLSLVTKQFTKRDCKAAMVRSKIAIQQKFNRPSVSKYQPSWFKKYCQTRKKLQEIRKEKETMENQGSSTNVTHMQQQEEDAAHFSATDLPQVLYIEYHKPKEETKTIEVPKSKRKLKLEVDSSPEEPPQKKQPPSSSPMGSTAKVTPVEKSGKSPHSRFVSSKAKSFFSNVNKKCIIVQRRIDVEDFKLKTNLIPLLEKSKLLKSVTLQASFVKSVICEFYCNLSKSCADPTDPMIHKVFLHGKTYKLSPAVINNLLDLTPCKKDTQISEKTMWLDLTNGQRASQSSKAKISSSILKSSYAVLLRVAALHWLPTTHTNTVSKIMARLLYKIKHNISFDLGHLIFDQIMLFAAEKYKINSIGLPYPTLLYSLLPPLQVDSRHMEGKHHNDMEVDGPTTAKDRKAPSLVRFLEQKLMQVKEELAKTSQLKEKLEVEKGHLVVLLLQAREATPDVEHTDTEEEATGSMHSDEEEDHSEGESEEGDTTLYDLELTKLCFYQLVFVLRLVLPLDYQDVLSVTQTVQVYLGLVFTKLKKDSELRRYLVCHNLPRYVDGTDAAPPPTILDEKAATVGDKEPVMKSNPAYEQWVIIDAQLRASLLALISPTVQNYVHMCTTAAEIWNHLHQRRVRALSMAVVVVTLEAAGDRPSRSGGRTGGGRRPGGAGRRLQHSHPYYGSNSISTDGGQSLPISGVGLGQVIYGGPCEHGLYTLPVKSPGSSIPVASLVLANAVRVTSHQWHFQLGHPSSQVTKFLFS